MPDKLLFHHVGVVCNDLDQEEATLSLLGYSRSGDDFYDPVQSVHGRFLAGQDPHLELLMPAEGSGVLSPWLSAGVKLYHLAYETCDLDGAIALLRGQNAKLLVAPVPAVAFGDRRIAFCMLKNRLLVELIESV
ncbi:MAG: VOC family protein [Syntrophobacteraceae bacterium]